MPDMIDITTVKTFGSPDPASWPITTAITEVAVRADGVMVTFGKKDGPNRWPDITPPGWKGPLQYTLWLLLHINGQWCAAGVIQYWFGLVASGGNITDLNADGSGKGQIAKNWVYDERWGPMAGHQPAPGETIGFMVTAGNQRGQNDFVVQERSNIVTFPMPAGVPQVFTFSGEVPTPPAPPAPPGPPTPPGPPAPPVPSEDFDELRADLRALRTEVLRLQSVMAGLTFPDYVGHVPIGALPGLPGFDVVLKPRTTKAS